MGGQGISRDDNVFVTTVAVTFVEVYLINAHQSLQCPKMWSGELTTTWELAKLPG